MASGQGARVIQLDQNLGYGRANNIGARAAETPYILIVNPDVIVQPGAIDALVHAANNDPDHVLFSPKIVEPDGRVFDQHVGLLGPFASGACFLMRRDVFLGIGGFDENIFLFYEDDDLCRRLSDRGQSPVYVDQAVIRHDRGKSTGDHEMNTPRPVRVRSEFVRRYHQAWSRFYVLKKFNVSSSVLKWVGFYGMKYIFAFLTLNPVRRSRYAGSFFGGD